MDIHGVVMRFVSIVWVGVCDIIELVGNTGSWQGKFITNSKRTIKYISIFLMNL